MILKINKCGIENTNIPGDFIFTGILSHVILEVVGSQTYDGQLLRLMGVNKVHIHSDVLFDLKHKKMITQQGAQRFTIDITDYQLDISKPRWISLGGKRYKMSDPKVWVVKEKFIEMAKRFA